MSQSDKIVALSARLDAATNEIAKDLQDLRDKIAAGTVSDADLAKLDTGIATLEQLGADPADPVPETPAPPAETPEPELPGDPSARR